MVLFYEINRINHLLTHGLSIILYYSTHSFDFKIMQTINVPSKATDNI